MKNLISMINKYFTMYFSLFIIILYFNILFTIFSIIYFNVKDHLNFDIIFNIYWIMFIFPSLSTINIEILFIIKIPELTSLIWLTRVHIFLFFPWLNVWHL